MPSDLYFLCTLIIGVSWKVCYGSEIPPLQVIFCSMPPFLQLWTGASSSACYCFIL